MFQFNEAPSKKTNKSLIPARVIKDFIYCPRMAYMEWIQGQREENLDSVSDRRSLKLVDEEKQTVSIDDDVEKGIEREITSITLSDQVLGIVSTFSMLINQDGSITPVDYKKGKRIHAGGGIYDPEKVQLCMQAILLKNNGYKAEFGIIYFAESSEHIKVDFDQEFIEDTLNVIVDFRNLEITQICPSPLENSHKCPRCELVAICLPDEINWYRGKEQAPRPIVVRTDERMPLYVQAPFGSIKKSGETLEIAVEQEKHTVRLAEINHLALYGNIQITTPAMQSLLQADIPVSWHSQGGWFYGYAQGLSVKNISLRVKQFKAAETQNKCLDVAKNLIKAKILNCRTMLRRNVSASQSDTVTALNLLKQLADQASRANDEQILLGIEGQAAAIYFKKFNEMLKSGAEQSKSFDFTGRNRRPPRDPVNALLSFAYAVLARTFTMALHAVGLDPALGFYHKIRPGRMALALDMMEPFRPILADSAVITAINNAEVNPASFVTRGDACNLTPKGRKTFIEAIERRLEQQIIHPYFGYKVSYRRLMELEARLLGRYLEGEIDHYIGFTTR